MTNAIVWVKSKSQDCVKAVILAQRMGLKVEVRDIDSNLWDLTKLQAAIPGATTLPQVVINDVVVGGLTELIAKSREQQAAPKVSYANKAARIAAEQAKGAAAYEARSAATADKMQAHRAKVAERTPEQQQAAKAKAQVRRAPANAAPAISHEQQVANHEAAKAARADKMAAVKAANADARAARIAAVKSRVAASTEALRQRVGV